jgi:hypothetical protein
MASSRAAAARPLRELPHVRQPARVHDWLTRSGSRPSTPRMMSFW